YLTLAALLLATPAFAAAPTERLLEKEKLVKMEVRPPALTFKTPFEYAQLQITGTLASGDVIDVTRMVTVEAPGCLNLSPTLLARPAADGEGALKLSLAGQSLTVPVK